MIRGHLKRTVAVLVVGLLSFSAEAIVFFQTGGSGVSESNLSRPFLFNLFVTMVSILPFLAVWLLAFAVLILWLRKRRIHRPKHDEQVSIGLANAEREFGIADTTEENPRRGYTSGEMIETRSLTYISVFFLPLALGTSALSGSGALGLTEFMAALGWKARLPFFVPRSATVITELDQMVSLCIGVTKHPH